MTLRRPHCDSRSCAAAANAPRRRSIAGLALAVAGLALTGPRLARAGRPITFGLTPVFLDSDIQLIRQIESYLSREIARPVQLVRRRTYQEISSMLVAGHIDAAWICGFPFVQHRPQLSLIAVPIYRSLPLYRAYLIVRSQRAASRAEDLRGDIHAFSDPDSNSGFLVTRAWLAERMESPAQFFGSTFFTFGHRNVIRAVAAGLAHSGSVDGYVWDVMREIEPALVEATRIVRVSSPMGFPPIAASRSTDPAIVDALRGALLRMPEDRLGAKILSTLRLDGFASPEPGLFDPIEAMWRRVQDAQ